MNDIVKNATNDIHNALDENFQNVAAIERNTLVVVFCVIACIFLSLTVIL